MNTQKIKVTIEATVPEFKEPYCDGCHYLEQIEWDSFYCSLFHKNPMPLKLHKIPEEWKNICRLPKCLEACKGKKGAKA